MPKPLFGDNGSGMHTHASIWKEGEPLFAGNGYAGLSQMALYATGGLLKHAPAILAFACPTTNSYKRLVPGFEAPVNLAYSQRNRSAAIRIPMYSQSPKAKRLEFRCPDPSCNPYLAFSAMLMAMIDGIQNKIDPGEPLDKDIYDLEPEELAKVPKAPGSLEESLAALGKDHEFLLRGDVFTERRDRDLDRLQDEKRGAGHAVASASLRILPVLRYLSGERAKQRGCFFRSRLRNAATARRHRAMRIAPPGREHFPLARRERVRKREFSVFNPWPHLSSIILRSDLCSLVHIARSRARFFSSPVDHRVFPLFLPVFPGQDRQEGTQTEPRTNPE